MLVPEYYAATRAYRKGWSGLPHGTRISSGPSCNWGPCLGPQPYCILICVDICSSCCYLKSVMSVVWATTRDHTASGPMPIWEAWTTKWDPDNIQAQAAAIGHVCFCWHAEAGFCVMSTAVLPQQANHVLKYEGHAVLAPAELTPPLNGLGRARHSSH